MTDIFRGEQVIRMPPLSKDTIARIAEAVLAVMCPEALETPTELDLARWVDLDLAERGIHVAPVTAHTLGDAEALTIPDREPGIEILLEQSRWDQLFEGGRRAHRARATVTHEFGHAILHVPTIRRRKSSAFGEYFLARVSRGSMKAYEDPEWQAWAFAGYLLAPRRMVATLTDKSPANLSRKFGMSEEMAANHLRRLGYPKA